MKRLHIIMAIFAFCLSSVSHAKKAEIKFAPTSTCLYATKDGQELYLDYYAPASGSETAVNGKAKPTIMFAFGGGFKEGSRDSQKYYYRKMTELGYSVVAIDYRLGMKGVVAGGGIGSFKLMNRAIHLVVEDIFSATAYLLKEGGKLGMDPNNIVLCGSSAGAISVLQSIYEVDARTSYTSVLPADYRYKGVMSFSGGIISNTGKLKFTSSACPFLMFHGTADKVVRYKQIKFLNIGFFGTSKIVERLERFGVIHHVYRYKDNGHEIAEQMDNTIEAQDEFLRRVVMGAEKVLVDATITEPTIEKWASRTTADLYRKK